MNSSSLPIGPVPDPSKSPSGQEAGETIPFTPKPIGAVVIRQPEFNQTVRTLNWNRGDAQRCRLCPTCGVNPCGTCTVILPAVLDNKSALTYRIAGGR